MGKWALAGAFLAMVLSVVPGNGYYAALGCAWFSFWFGWMGLRRRQDPGWARISGATAVTLSLFALLISGTRFAATLAALSEMKRLLQV